MCMCVWRLVAIHLEIDDIKIIKLQLENGLRDSELSDGAGEKDREGKSVGMGK